MASFQANSQRGRRGSSVSEAWLACPSPAGGTGGLSSRVKATDRKDLRERITDKDRNQEQGTGKESELCLVGNFTCHGKEPRHR